jgi:AraC-like DNA-binding protein
VQLDLEGQRLRRRVTMVGSNVPHAFDAGGEGVALVLLDASDTAVRRLAAKLHAAELWPQLEGLELPSHGWPPRRLSTWADALLARLGAEGRSGIVSGPTRRALRYVEERLEEMPRLEVAAERAGLSPSRLRHLFRSEVGLPFRRFILWARLRRAAELAARGLSITAGAVGAGFSDGAHFSRTFRRHFGLSPSDVLPLIEHAWPTP